jgi:hypothetical protein
LAHFFLISINEKKNKQGFRTNLTASNLMVNAGNVFWGTKHLVVFCYLLFKPTLNNKAMQPERMQKACFQLLIHKGQT